MVNRVSPFLMFQGEAEAAMNLHMSLVSGAKSIDRYGPGEAGAEGSVMPAQLSIGGETIVCIDSPVKHEFSFTPAFSLFVDCDSESELEHLASALAEGGAVLMPLANYGFSRQFAYSAARLIRRAKYAVAL
ncbi:VOC family protein [Ensifer sp. MPMI2T]|nr:VOC family protein [Ensifer sp. MPMI2T]